MGDSTYKQGGYCIMEFNLVVPGIELVGTTVKTLTIGNNIVDVEKEAKRSFGLNINEPHFEETNDVFFAQMTIDFEIDIEQSENQNCQIQLSLEGAFISSSDVDKDTFRQLVIVNGARMFGMVQDLLHTEKDDDFNKVFSRVEKYENISDSMELEIANYLNQVSEGRLSSESKLQIRAMLREVTEIESIGDSCYNLARTINRKRQTNQDFTEKQYEHIHFMMKLTDDALAQMIVVVEHPEHASNDVNKSFNIENEINNYRNQLKNQNILDVNNKEYDYQMGVYYMDIIAECEKLGDYVVNVVEASSDIKEKKAS